MLHKEISAIQPGTAIRPQIGGKFRKIGIVKQVVNTSSSFWVIVKWRGVDRKALLNFIDLAKMERVDTAESRNLALKQL